MSRVAKFKENVIVVGLDSSVAADLHASPIFSVVGAAMIKSVYVAIVCQQRILHLTLSACHGDQHARLLRSIGTTDITTSSYNFLTGNMCTTQLKHVTVYKWVDNVALDNCVDSN